MKKNRKIRILDLCSILAPSMLATRRLGAKVWWRHCAQIVSRRSAPGYVANKS